MFIIIIVVVVGLMLLIEVFVVKVGSTVAGTPALSAYPGHSFVLGCWSPSLHKFTIIKMCQKHCCEHLQVYNSC